MPCFEAQHMNEFVCQSNRRIEQHAQPSHANSMEVRTMRL